MSKLISTSELREQDESISIRRREGSPTRVASLLGIGHALPVREVKTAELTCALGVDEEWVTRRTGVRGRHFADPDDTLVELAAQAGNNALGHAGISAADLSMVIVATMTPDQVTPNVAPVVAQKLEAVSAGAVDVGAACTGWLAGLSMASALVESGRAQYVLLIGADLLSRITDFTDKRTAGLFGDGAGAAVIGLGGALDQVASASSAEGLSPIGSLYLRSNGDYADLITCAHDGGKLVMDGHETFKVAVNVLVSSTQAVLEHARIPIDSVDLFVYHQANGRILSAVADRLSIPQSKVLSYIEQTGNTSAASIPLSLSLAHRDGLLHKGDRLLLGAVGAGFTWGAGLIEWGVA